MSGSYPLTALQEGMFAGAFNMGRPWLYLEQIVCHMDDVALDSAQMAQAWTDIAARHPTLRTTIDGSGTGAPVQRVHPAATIEVVVEHWQDCTAGQINAAFSDFITRDRNRGVDPGIFPAFRVTLIQTGEQSSRLVWTFPHTLLDGRSFATILTEVFTRYEALLRGETDAPNAVDNLFQRHCEELAALDHSAGAAYFGNKLQGWDGGTGLVNLDAEPARKQYIDRHLTRNETTALEQLAQSAGVTMSTVVLAAWGIVNARFTGRDEAVFGTTLNGRHLVPDTRTAVGCFIVTVPLRVKLETGLTIGDVLRRLRNDQNDLRPYEQTPLTAIRARTGVPRNRLLFDTAVMFETATLDGQMKALGGAWADRRVDLLEEGDVPVTLAAYQGDAMQVTLEYDPDQAADAPSLAEYMLCLLRHLTEATPDTPLAQITMLAPDQLALVHTLAGPVPVSPQPHCCAALFEKAAQARADHPAVTQVGEASLSYGALDTNANRLAHALIEHGVKAGDIVGICAARGPAFVTALLAIWKAGAAFVPMDPGYPAETLRIIAEDSRARLILADGTAPAFEVETLNLTEVGHARPENAPDRSGMAADRRAYVIFTSGSTGRPKGVMVSHASLAAHAAAVARFYGIVPEDRALQFASLSFDVALEEIVPTLLAGATLCLRNDEMAQSATELLDQCATLGLTVLNLPTGYWVALTEVMETLHRGLPDCIRLVIVGGERVPLSVLRRWRVVVPDVRWINGYGPTETTITCTAHELSNADLNSKSVPIGKPMGHAQAWILSADGALAPPETDGELWITGPAVADGYVGAPTLTAQKFIPAPFDTERGQSYGTGDRARWQNGLLHFVGRVDRQIKLRGYRIDPGQIESVLESCDDIGRAHVAPSPPEGPDQRLIAWYSAADLKRPPSPDDVRLWLATVLPSHMQPELIPVDRWPQTPGGKIDTARLPKPAGPALKVKGGEAPNTPLTQEVADLFAQILNVGNVAADSSFFDLGGNSLSFLRFLALIEQKFGARIRSTSLFADPTPRGVVQALKTNNPDPLVVLPIQPKGTRIPLYGVHVLGDNGSFFRPLSQALGNDQPVFGLTVGLLTKDTPKTVKDIARFYLHQLERHHPEGPLALVAVSAGSYVTLELAQQLLAAGREVHALILLDAEGPDGRQRIGKLARIRVHISELLRKGWPYIANLIAKKREEREHAAALNRLRDHQQHAGTVAEDISSVADFVAANTKAIDDYIPQPYPRRITIFRAGDDRFDSTGVYEDGLGWARIATAGFDIQDVPGDHLGILEPDNVAILARQIARTLARE